jgi:hypothetical protein
MREGKIKEKISTKIRIKRKSKHTRPKLNLKLPITFATEIVATFHQLHGFTYKLSLQWKI